jgi:hypothetical protein
MKGQRLGVRLSIFAQPLHSSVLAMNLESVCTALPELSISVGILADGSLEVAQQRCNSHTVNLLDVSETLLHKRAKLLAACGVLGRAQHVRLENALLQVRVTAS